MTDLQTRPPIEPVEPDVPPARRWVKVLLALICAGIAAMWVYAFVFAGKDGVYRVKNDQWRSAAQTICKDAQDRRLALADTEGGYIANPTVEQMRQRADIVDQATDIIERMLNDVVALPLTTDHDQHAVDVWQRYFRILIEDRRAYTARLRTGELAPYRESVVEGGPVTNVITDFTSGNNVKSCAPPGELNGDA